MTKILYIYPEQSDDIFRSFLLDQTTDLQELNGLIKEEFGLPEEYKLCFTWYSPEDLKQHAVPLSSLKSLILSQEGSELSLRLRNHPPLFPNPGYGNSSSGSSSSSSASYSTGNGKDPWENDVYFGQYAQMHIHWEMLSDKRRCKAYYDAVMVNKNCFKDKVVLDVGCGTGLLSVFAAQAGAKKVYAVDACGIVQQAQSVVKINGFQDVIEVIQGQIEHIELPVKNVDIIISEWMGYFLIFESMLESVLFARDKWLTKEGLLFPCEANLYLAPIDYGKYYREKIEFFNNPVESVVVTPLITHVRDEFTNRCLRCSEIKPEEIITDSPFVLKKIDLKTATVDQIRNTKESFEFKVSPSLHPFCHGFGTWFDVTFRGTDPSVPPVVLSTHPSAGYSHWRQDVFLFKKPIKVEENGVVKGTIRVSQMHEWKRHFVIQINAGTSSYTHFREWTI